MKKVLCALGLMFTAVSSALATTYPLTIENCGYQETFTRPPERVVALGQNTVEILLLLGKAGITPYITQEVGEAMTIIGLVSAGLGVSILPASFARVRVDGVRYLPLAEPDATTEVWLVHHRRRPLTAAAQALMALMLK